MRKVCLYNILKRLNLVGVNTIIVGGK